MCLSTPKEQAEAMETHMDDLAVKSMGEDLDAAVSSSGLPRETAPITANEITSWQRDNVRLWSNDWKKGQTVSPKVKAMGQDTLFKLETITADNPGDESLRTELSNLMVLRQTDPELFTDTFGATDAAKMETLYNAINKSGGKPWAAVARYNQEAERTHQNGGVRMEASPEKVESDMEKFKEDFLEEVDLSGTDGFLWFDKTEPENWFEIQSIARDYYEEAYARQGDGTQAIAEAKARLLKGGTLVGNNFIPGGQAMVDGTVNGVKVNQWLQGISDDSDTRAAVIETYGLDSNVDLVNDLRFARTSPDGAILYGTIENAQGIGMPVQFGRPTRTEQVLKTDAAKRTELVKTVLRTSRDAVQEVYNVGAANNGKQPLQNAGESVIGGFTKLVTGRSANATPEQIEANAAHVAATQKLKDFDAEQHLKDNTYVGEAAIKQVEELEGRTLSYMERIVVKDEGFVANGVEYQDKKGMATGVGQTGEYMGLSFDESFKAHVNKARGMTAGFDKYPEYLRAQIVSATYRGSWGLSGKTRKLLAAGKPMEAAVEFLDNDEFRAKTTPDGVKARMQRVADALTAYAQQSN